MPEARKIACIGGGSLFFRRALPDLLVSPDLGGSEIVLYDLNLDKARIMTQMGQRLAQEAGTGCIVRAAETLDDALDSADFALSSIGGSGGGLTQQVYRSSYHGADIHIPMKYGIYQVVGDTCGPAGMMMGLRSVPAYLEIARTMEQRCPNAILVNHSNPMAVLCRALNKYTGIQTIGLCHGVQAGIRYAAGLLGVPPHELSCTWVGTNHYYWFTRVAHKGRDMHAELLARLAEQQVPAACQMAKELSLAYRHQIVYPQDDHIIEFYPFGAQVRSIDELPYDLPAHARRRGVGEGLPSPQAGPPSAEEREAALREYADLVNDTALPAQQEDALTGEGIGALLSAIATGRREVFIVNIPNQGAIPNLPATGLVEIEAVTDACGVRGVNMGQCPLTLKGILEKRFVWQELVVDAAVKGDRNLALQALLIDEMAIRPDRAAAMLDELLAASRPLLPQFAD